MTSLRTIPTSRKLHPSSAAVVNIDASSPSAKLRVDASKTLLNPSYEINPLPGEDSMKLYHKDAGRLG
jgi:hypothetical protein